MSMWRWAVLWLAAGCAVSGPDVQIRPVDFGVVEPAIAHHAELRVQNLGVSPAKLLRVERRSGPDAFTITPAQVQLAAGEHTTWRVTFLSSSPGLAEARFAAVFDTGVAEFTLRARVGERCVFAETFDVGDARVGHVTSRTLTVTNPLDVPGEVFIGAPLPPFSVEPSGTLLLAAHESREVTVRFSPLSSGRPEARWLLRPSTDCTATAVTLTGLGVDAPLSLFPGRLDFGVLVPGTPRALPVAVFNHTRRALTLTALTLDTAAFRIPAQRPPVEFPLVVPSGGAVSLLVEALAADAAPFDATLRLSTDAAEQPELSLPLLANRTAPCLSASRERLDFPSLEVGCRSRDERVSITNTCPHGVRLAESAVSPGFAFVSTPGQRVLAPGEAADFALTHAPATVGAATGTLMVAADVLDGNQALVVPLAGNVTPALEVEEAELIRSLIPPQDVLMVLDDSAAMLPLAGSMRQNLRAWVQYLAANELDVRLGVMSTSTAPAELGRLRRTAGGAAWLTNPAPEELEALGEVRGLSTARSSCLEVLLAALSPPLRNDPAELGGMLRRGAVLHVICVTNGRDGVEAAPLPVISALLALLPEWSSIAVVARFAPISSSCGGELEHGPLSALVMETNGIKEEICTPNWATALERIGKTAFGWRPRFYLHQRPALTRGPLRVFMDGTEVPAIDPNPNLRSRIWEYDGASNAVLFEPLYVPEPGRTVRFRFPPDCAP
ncbi:MAG: choice-of-anchor D domain-containing protein [Archangium sp.]|nr:choice-of-anchor D domain-containing protein [Archangium sp.]